VRLLLDEMYSSALAEALQAVGIDATTASALRLSGAADSAVFAAAVSGDYVVLTENVGDFARIAAEHATAGGSHPGVLIALSSRFSRRAAYTSRLVAAIAAVAKQSLTDRIVYLERQPEP
jgi:predicted nuclease of predicted toxin-antitoxin system